MQAANQPNSRAIAGHGSPYIDAPVRDNYATIDPSANRHNSSMNIGSPAPHGRNSSLKADQSIDIDRFAPVAINTNIYGNQGSSAAGGSRNY